MLEVFFCATIPTLTLGKRYHFVHTKNNNKSCVHMVNTWIITSAKWFKRPFETKVSFTVKEKTQHSAKTRKEKKRTKTNLCIIILNYFEEHDGVTLAVTPTGFIHSICRIKTTVGGST
jgi:hypothetical protein